MKPGLTWVITAIVGAAANLTTSFGQLAVLLFLVATTH
jgi:hypothetical protein